MTLKFIDNPEVNAFLEEQEQAIREWKARYKRSRGGPSRLGVSQALDQIDGLTETMTPADVRTALGQVAGLSTLDRWRQELAAGDMSPALAAVTIEAEVVRRTDELMTSRPELEGRPETARALVVARLNQPVRGE